MARSRNIKPSLFKNEDLGAADPLLTILFTGLWCLADRAGYLEDRPARIKAEVFPYRDGLDINVYLTELERLSFIRRFTAPLGPSLIHVTKFLEHQHPHVTEKPSEFAHLDTAPWVATVKPIHVKPTLNNPIVTEPQPEDTGTATYDSLNTDSFNSLTHEDELKTGTTIAEPAPARMDGEPVPPNIDETWGFLEDELGTPETEPAPLGQESQERAPVSHFENPLIDEAIAAMDATAEKHKFFGGSTASPTEFTGLSSRPPCAHEHTIVTTQGEVDRDRTCTDCGLTWIEAREYTSAPVGFQPKPKVKKKKIEDAIREDGKQVWEGEPIPTMAEAVEVDPAQLPVITPPMLEKIVEGLQKLGPQAPAQPVAEPFQPGPRASGMVVQELLDNCKTHSINTDSIWLYAVQKGYARPGADGSRNWMSLSEHGAGRFLNLMQPAKLRGLKEHLRAHFESEVTA